MIVSLALFPTTADQTEVEACIRDLLVPAFEDSPGVVSVRGSEGPLMSPGGPPAYSRVVEASFREMSDLVAFGQNPATAAARSRGEELGAVVLMYATEDLQATSPGS